MTDASLPDRVDPARVAAMTEVLNAPGTGWPVSRHTIARALAAADACEAERNPNTTDEALALCIIALEAIASLAKYTDTAGAIASSVLADKRVVGFVRRPVRSEDAHREAKT